MLVREASVALGAFRHDPAGMVAACRRIIDRQLTCAPLWWLCARMLCAPEPMREGHEAVIEMEADPTGRLLAAAIPDDASVVVVGWPAQAVAALRRRGDLEVLVVDVAGEARDAVDQLEALDVEAVEVPSRSLATAVGLCDLVLIDALAVGPQRALVPAGSLAAAAVARHLEVPVWVIGGVGRLMPGSMFDALVNRWTDAVDPLDAQDEVMTLELADAIAGVAGVLDVEAALRHTDCPVAPELFRLAG